MHVSHETGGISQCIKNALESYHELNSSTVEVLDEVPSALEFMQYVARNRPFVVKGGVRDWKACKKWNYSYLKVSMDEKHVLVANTPHGNADSVLERRGQRSCFVKPWEQEEDFGTFIDYVRDQERGQHEDEVVKYAQTQNDNLRGEYEALFDDVEKDLGWARLALGRDPEAINLWIGNSRSVTALHKDPYENIYCQIIGTKHFVLMPPMEVACVNEKILPSATYKPTANGSQSGSLLELKVHIDSEGSEIPFATWDPDRPAEQRNQFSHLSRPIRVDLNKGDLLYLPALWFHKVSQSCGQDGICCAVNYWFDMNWDGHLWPTTSLIRDLTLKCQADELDPDSKAVLS